MSVGAATPKAAAYVIFRDGNKIAFLLRANTSWMNDHYGLPAGKVEQHESFSSAAIREAREEVGVTLQPSQLLPVLFCHRQEPDEDNSWVDMMFEVTSWDGELANAEPQVHAELTWLELDNLPSNVVPSLAAMLRAYRAGKSYFEYGWDV